MAHARAGLRGLHVQLGFERHQLLVALRGVIGLTADFDSLLHSREGIIPMLRASDRPTAAARGIFARASSARASGPRQIRE